MKKFISVVFAIFMVVFSTSVCFAGTDACKSFSKAKSQSNLCLPGTDDIPINDLDYKVRELMELRDDPEKLAGFLKSVGLIDKYIDKAEESRREKGRYIYKDYSDGETDTVTLAIYFFDDGDLWLEAYQEAQQVLGSIKLHNSGSIDINRPTPVIKNGIAGETSNGHIDEPEL